MKSANKAVNKRRKMIAAPKITTRRLIKTRQKRRRPLTRGGVSRKASSAVGMVAIKLS
jgi:hypothetical protein